MKKGLYSGRVFLGVETYSDYSHDEAGIPYLRTPLKLQFPHASAFNLAVSRRP